MRICRCCVAASGTLLALCLMLAACGSGVTGDRTEARSEPANTPRPVPTATRLALPETVPQLCAMIGDLALASRARLTRCETFNVNGRGAILDGTWLSVEYQLNGLDDGAALTAELGNILRVIHYGQDISFKRVEIGGTLPVTNAFGNTADESMFIANWTRDDIERINWDGFVPARVFEISNDAHLSPDLAAILP